MYKTSLSLFLIVAYLGSIYCVIYDIGFCPSEKPLKQTDGSKTFFGKWYEIARVESDFEKSLKCITFDISPNTTYLEGHPITQIGYDSKNLEYIYVANLQLWDDDARLEYGEFIYSYTVIDTDYDNYAVVLGCSFVPPFGYWFPWVLVRIRTAWILARTPTIDAGLQSKLIDTLANHGIGASKLTFNVVENCPASYFYN